MVAQLAGPADSSRQGDALPGPTSGNTGDRCGRLSPHPGASRSWTEAGCARRAKVAFGCREGPSNTPGKGCALKLRLTIDGSVYEVEVEVAEEEPPHPSYVPPMPFGQAKLSAAHVPSAPAPAGPLGDEEKVADESKVCRSPLAGTVTRVNSQVGQTIQPNDVLLVIEAMKMESAITAPVAGKIAKINVQAGDPVAQRQVLVEFE